MVFDCSARYDGVSLNDALLQGPDLNNPLIGVLMSFTQNQVTGSCDVEITYHRFGEPLTLVMIYDLFGLRMINL